MKRLMLWLATALGLLGADAALAYPLDGEDESGIRRLQGYRMAQEAPGGAKLAPGQLWSINEVKLHLQDYAGPDFDALEPDPELIAALNKMLKNRDPSYAMTLVDFTDPDNIRWAALRPDLKQNPGSVGKLLCMAAVFHGLANAFPNTDERARILSTAVSRADDWVNSEVHDVPKWDEAAGRNRFSVLNSNDTFRLSEWIDHAVSASANGAGTVIWREAMLLEHFGSEYPVDQATRDAFFSSTSKVELAALARHVIVQPLINARIDIANLQQGSMFTGNGKRKVPGTVSFATGRELARLLFRIEQGQLVDTWSSLQMKKFMYLTKRRYRYSYAPELAQEAVFFKSGSLYSCRPEDDFRCQKYMGNKQNLMNSVAIVESRDRSGPAYIAVLMTNVLKFNSAWDHSRIAAATHAVMSTGQAHALKESASAKEVEEAGRSQ